MAISPPLGMAASFAALGGTTVTSTGATDIVGDVGVSPGTSITGFPPGVITGGGIHAGDPLATRAAADLATAYGDLSGEPVDTILSGQDLGGKTLTPGVYNFATSAMLSGGLTLDAQGNSKAVFVIQIGTTLTTAADSSVTLIDDARASNVFWQVGSSATIGTDSALQGSILAYTSIVLDTGASLSPGRALAINGAVTMDTNAISSDFTSPLTITADDQTSTYGAAIPPLTASYAGFIDGETAADLTTLPKLSTTANASSPVGTYDITATGAVDPDYTFSYVVGHLTITKASLTIAADSESTTYGAALPSLTASYSGFVNGDTSTQLSTQPTLTTAATSSSDVAGSPYLITAGVAADANYAISYTDGGLFVAPAPLTITAVDQTRTYGQANPTFTATYSGFVLGQGSAALGGTLNFATAATQATDFGIYPVTPSGQASSNYAITYVGGGIAITPADLAITAVDQTRTYGQANPTFTATYSGFVLGQDASSLEGSLAFDTPATQASHFGIYPVSVGGLSSPSRDYIITDVGGGIAITPAPLTITAPSLFKVYGQAVPALTPTFTGLVNGDTPASLTTPVTLTTPLSVASHVGFYPVVASGATSMDYAVTEDYGISDVLPAYLTATPGSGFSVYGQAVPGFAITYSGFVNGDTSASLTTPATAQAAATKASLPGFYPVLARGGSAGDYAILESYGILDVLPPAPASPASAPGLSAFVASLYEDLLGRAPEPFGLGQWVNLLDQGATGAAVDQAIYSSPEAVGYRAGHPGQTVSLDMALTDAEAAEQRA